MKYLLHTLLFAIALPLTAQDVQKCCGTSSSTFLLGNTEYSRHTQCLYTPADFTGATTGTIARLYYRYGSSTSSGNTLGDISISLLQTDAISLTGITFLTGLETVLETSSLTIPPGTEGEWFSIDLDTPFNYDPTRSLVVDIRFSTSATETFGTMATGGTVGRKVMSGSTTDTSGETWDTLQDLGFDLGPVGIDEQLMRNAVLAPNPTQGRCELRLPAPLRADATMTLSDPAGRSLWSMQANAGADRLPIDLRALPAGVYALQVRDARGTILTRRLVRE